MAGEVIQLDAIKKEESITFCAVLLKCREKEKEKQKWRPNRDMVTKAADCWQFCVACVSLPHKHTK